MNNAEIFMDNFKNSKGFKGKIKNKIFKFFIDGISSVNQDNLNNTEKLNNLENRVNSIQDQVNAISQKLENTEKQVNKSILNLDKHFNNSNNNFENLKNNFENLCINVTNNNTFIANLQSEVALSSVNLNRLKNQLKNVNNIENSNVNNSTTTSEIKNQPEQSDYDVIDYFDFENHFRGSISSIKELQKQYLPYFIDKKKVIDIGCGRGEFLSLLKENNISAEGVDVYEPYVDYCTMNGLKATCGDGIAYLSKQSSADGIFVGQVVEHLTPEMIITLCNTAFEKLSENGCIVIETPNPQSLAIYTNAFYIDPSHVKPVHPLTMKYYLEKSGFKNIKIIYTESSRVSIEIPEIACENSEEFNKAMKIVSDKLFGSQDYAIIATK